MGFGLGCGVGWGPGFGPEVIGYVGAGCGVGFSVGFTVAGFGIGLPANYLFEVPYNVVTAVRSNSSELGQFGGLISRKSIAGVDLFILVRVRRIDIIEISQQKIIHTVEMAHGHKIYFSIV
ncbi:hypothetical protein NL676_010973 [Syzygium grande]|nr:hypothetical protein NL676_010973 [Syzygium grande]